MSKPTRHYSKKQERRGNALLGLSNVPNSGATAFNKGDGVDEWLLMEWKTKTAESKSHTLQKEWFEKNKEEAFAQGKNISAVGFDFGDGKDYIAVDIITFKHMYEAWKEQYT